MFKQIDYTMVVVSDMQRSVEFYRDKLGLSLKFQSPDTLQASRDDRFASPSTARPAPLNPAALHPQAPARNAAIQTNSLA